MTLSRRDFLKLTGLVATSTALAACATPVGGSPGIFQRAAGQPPLSAWTPLPGTDFLALNRLTFGPRRVTATNCVTIRSARTTSPMAIAFSRVCFVQPT